MGDGFRSAQPALLATSFLYYVRRSVERDREVQFGLTVPVRGWSVDLNRYDQRASNYFDHNAIGDSNVFFPLTIAGGPAI